MNPHNMTEREEAFIAQARIIDEILDYKNQLITESNRTIGNCFNHTAISGVTSDPYFEKEVKNKTPNLKLLAKIDLCDRLVLFCKNTPLSLENAMLTKFLFNNGKFRPEHSTKLTRNIILMILFLVILPTIFIIGLYFADFQLSMFCAFCGSVLFITKTPIVSLAAIFFLTAPFVFCITKGAYYFRVSKNLYLYKNFVNFYKPFFPSIKCSISRSELKRIYKENI